MYIKQVADIAQYGSIAQLGEHLPYKQRVTGSSPVVSTKYGPVVQLVRTLACHARGRRFEPVPGRHICLCSSVGRAGDWKSPCHWFDSDRRHHPCGFSSSGRAPPCQGGGSEFEPRNPLFSWRYSQVVRQWSATPWSPVQIRVAPPVLALKGKIRHLFWCRIFLFHQSVK